MPNASIWPTFAAAIEHSFFEELDARLNLVAVDYLLYATEVGRDIWARARKPIPARQSLTP